MAAPALNRCTAEPADGVCFGDNLCRLHGCTKLDCNCDEGP